jgi:Spy/CpxP family protein refolding chaperone
MRGRKVHLLALFATQAAADSGNPGPNALGNAQALGSIPVARKSINLPDEQLANFEKLFQKQEQGRRQHYLTEASRSMTYFRPKIMDPAT